MHVYYIFRIFLVQCKEHTSIVQKNKLIFRFVGLRSCHCQHTAVVGGRARPPSPLWAEMPAAFCASHTCPEGAGLAAAGAPGATGSSPRRAPARPRPVFCPCSAPCRDPRSGAPRHLQGPELSPAACRGHSCLPGWGAELFIGRAPVSVLKTRCSVKKEPF